MVNVTMDRPAVTFKNMQSMFYIMTYLNNNNPHLMAFFQDNLGKLAPERQNHSGFYQSRRWWGGSGINQLNHMQTICTLLQTDNHASISSLINICKITNL